MKKIILTIVILLLFFTILFVIGERAGWMDEKFIEEKIASLQAGFFRMRN